MLIFFFALSFNAMSQDIKVVFCGKSKGKISLADTSCTLAEFQNKGSIVKFEMSMVDTGYMFFESSNSERLSRGQINLIKKAKIGKQIYFEEIKLRLPDSTIIEIDPLIFIKE